MKFENATIGKNVTRIKGNIIGRVGNIIDKRTTDNKVRVLWERIPGVWESRTWVNADCIEIVATK